MESGSKGSLAPKQHVVEYNSDASFENDLHGQVNEDFYEGALKNTEGIYENQLGPSGEFVDSYSPPQMRYKDPQARRISVEMHETTLAKENQDLQEANNTLSEKPTTTQLLRYEASSQSVMHGLIPSAIGMAAVGEDDQQSSDEEDPKAK